MAVVVMESIALWLADRTRRRIPGPEADPAAKRIQRGRLADSDSHDWFHDPDRGPSHRLAPAHRRLAGWLLLIKN